MSEHTPTEESLAAARDLLDRCNVLDVRPTTISAKLLAETPGSIEALSFDPQLEWATAPGVFRNRFTYSFVFDGADGEPVAALEFVLVVEWSVPEDYEPSQDAAEFVASTTGYFAAFPYVRELAQSCAVRLGLDPVVLGALNRNQLKPGAIRFLSRSAGVYNEFTMDTGDDEQDSEPPAATTPD
jgi:hypothetical protein